MNKIVFYLLSFTWGIVMSVVGAFAFVYCKMRGCDIKRFDNCYYAELGENWGGVEFGWFYVVNKNASAHILKHELGHGYQNCYCGPFFLIISIMSMVRYHYRNYLKNKNPEAVLPPYDSIWFEGWATAIGEKITKREGKQ